MADTKMIFTTTLLQANTPDEEGNVYTKECLESLCAQLNGENSPITNVKGAKIVEIDGVCRLDATIEASIKFELG